MTDVSPTNDRPAIGLYAKLSSGRRRCKTDARAIYYAQRTRRWLQLRLAGWTLQQIADAEEKKISAGRIGRVIAAHLKQITLEPAEEIKRLELMRLDKMFCGLAERAFGGDVKAIDRALSIMQRRAAYLGLDAPTKTRIEDVSAVAAVKAALLAKLDDMAGKVGAPQTIEATAIPDGPEREAGDERQAPEI